MKMNDYRMEAKGWKRRATVGQSPPVAPNTPKMKGCCGKTGREASSSHYPHSLHFPELKNNFWNIVIMIVEFQLEIGPRRISLRFSEISLPRFSEILGPKSRLVLKSPRRSLVSIFKLQIRKMFRFRVLEKNSCGSQHFI